MRSLAHCLPSLLGFEGPKTHAAWPMWSDSTTPESAPSRPPLENGETEVMIGRCVHLNTGPCCTRYISH